MDLRCGFRLYLFLSFERFCITIKCIIDSITGMSVALLLAVSTVNLRGASNSNMFRNNLQIRLSPLKSPILRKYINPFKRPGMYPSISKCNAKKCNCCNHLCSKTTITSSVNGRTFSVVNDSDSD